MKARHIWLAAAALWLAAAARDGVEGWIAQTDLPPLVIETGTEVTARDGRLLRAWTVADGRWRLAPPPEGVDPLFTAMLLAFEDRRFNQHSGVDLRALARASLQAVSRGRVVSGGSTLSMQVARLLEESGTGKWQGKLRQIRLALALERKLSKPQILALYHVLAPYGGNIEGIRAASLMWFGREPSRLTPAQAALLVALPQSPETRRPDRHPQAARLGRDRVLARAEAAGLIDQATANAARSEAIPQARRPMPRLSPHLADRLRQDQPLRPRHATTLDAALQQRLEALATSTAARLGPRMSLAMMVAEHSSGQILASVGSSSYDNDQRLGFIDMTQALRSPGSTLKPMVYAMAFDQGLAHPETLIEDQPVAFGRYAPQNFDRRYRGTIRLREALQQSLNIPVVLLTEALGPERLMQDLRRSGMRAVLPGRAATAPGLAVALGGVGVTLEGLTSLYATLARGGVTRPLTARAEGGATEGERLLSSVAAWQVGDILAGLAPPDGSPKGRVAWKTGTSYGHRDAWALGWDGRHVVGVWVGQADGTPVPGAFGGDLAAPILFEAFGRISGTRAPLPLPPPATLLLENARLPQPLQRFRAKGALHAPNLEPQIAFPPAGAEVALEGAPLLVRVRGGTAPFTWLLNGHPLAIGQDSREALLAPALLGAQSLAVVDALGRAHRITLTLSP